MSVQGKRFYLLTLGCPKNDVDSDFLTSRLLQAGWTREEMTDRADILMVNTCSFIVPAVEETVEAILEVSDLREGGKRRLVVLGCLVSRYGVPTLEALLPEVDLFVDFGDYHRLVRLMDSLSGEAVGGEPGGTAREYSSTLHGGYVFIKIAEGCSRRCTFCTIPAIRGSLRSRRWEDIIDEGRFFVEHGAKELVLIAQDTTLYGQDLYRRPSLPFLIDKMAEIDGDFRLRVMYMHPEGIDRAILESMLHPRVCRYLDIPFQHVDPDVLKAMGRGGGEAEHKELLHRVRHILGEVALRSTFMVGFPGEDRFSYRRVYDFVAEMRFDWLGLFGYSQEEETPASSLGRGVSRSVSEDRLEEIRALQEEIMREKAEGLIGDVFQVLVEGRSSEAPGYWEARSWREAPEIDGVVYLPDSEDLSPGTFHEVEISDSEGIDLIGRLRVQNKESEGK